VSALGINNAFTANEALIDEINDRDYVNSLARGLGVIRAFTRQQPKMTLSEVAQATGMTRASVRRFLFTLVREGYVEATGRYFSLRPRILELGFTVLSSMDIWLIARPIMNELSERIQESCFAAILDEDDVIYVARATSNRVVNVGISIGSRVPAYCVSTGRVLLAALPAAELHAYLERVKLDKFTPNTVVSKPKLRAAIEETRRQGWSIVDQELEIGLRSLSVPIRDRAQRTVAALNVCCPSARVTPEEMGSRVLAELLDASQRIAMALHS
jgi:IclR family pca regulon transcriptional regulator